MPWYSPCIFAAMLVVPAGCSAPPAPGSPAPASPADTSGATPPDQAPTPRLVVQLIIDQLPMWTFTRDLPHLDGGIARLVREGRYYTRAAYPYAVTYTAPGHAALGTGAPPAVHGILANDWYRPALGRAMSAVTDPDAPVFVLADVGPDFRPEGQSGAQLRAPGTADALRRATGGRGKSVSISLKARAAAFALGQKPDLAVWLDPGQPAMTTSRYYRDTAPAWLARLAREQPIAGKLDYRWTPLDEARLRTISGQEDDVAGEGPHYGLDRAFPHDLGESSAPAKALRATPLGDDILIETALAAIDGEALGADDIPDVLSISFSAHDYAGHYWGQESWERLDILLRLDRRVGALLEVLDQRFGRDGYAVVLTSDHGATPLIDASVRKGREARRIPLGDLREKAERAATSVLGAPDGAWVAAVSSASVWLAPAFDALPAARQSAALDAITAAIAAVPGIAFAVRVDRIAGDCDRRTGNEAMACLSVIAGESGAIYFGAVANSLITDHHVGTSHGSTAPHDREVPIVVMAPGVPAGHDDTPASPLSVAPTIAALLGIEPPAHATAPVLPGVMPE